MSETPHRAARLPSRALIGPGLLLLMPMVLVFHPVVRTYGFTDDYVLLWQGDTDPVFYSVGRHLSAALYHFVFSLATQVQHLVPIRLTAFAGLLASCWFLLHLLNRYGHDRWTSFFVVGCFACSAFSTTVVAWAALFVMPWIMLLALVCGELAVRGSEAAGSRRAVHFALSFVLGLVCLFFHQAPYTAFVVPVFLKALRTSRPSRLGFAAGVHLLTYATYFALFRALAVLELAPSSHRTGIQFDVLEKLLWFFQVPLPRALAFNFVLDGRVVANLVAVVSALVIAAFIYRRGKGRRPATRVSSAGILFVFLVFSYLPAFAVEIEPDYYVSHRTLGTLGLLIILLFVLSIDALVGSTRWKVGLLTAVLAIFTVNAWHNIGHGLIETQTREYLVLRDAVARIAQERGDLDELIVRSPRADFLYEDCRVMYYVERGEKQWWAHCFEGDEYGLLSTASFWAADPFFRLVLAEAFGRAAGRIDVRIVENDAVVDDSGSSAIVDVESLFLGNERPGP